MKNSKKNAKPKIVAVTPAGERHQVVTVCSDSGISDYMKSPCKDCPWKVSSTGEFPAEAFIHSATTAYDMASNTFACHSAGCEKPKTCAGFLLIGSDHNLAVRMKRILGENFDGLNDGGHELFKSYREMAIANGVEDNHPALAPCRD